MATLSPSGTHEAELRALHALSDALEPLNIGTLNQQVQNAPDPETAVQAVLEQIQVESDTLTRKWRNVITDLWAQYHPHVPILPELTLTSSDITTAPVLRDAQEVLRALEGKPAKLVEENNEWLLEPEDVQRLIKVMPSQADSPQLALENEWSSIPLRRLRAILHATRLVRPMKGELVPVRSRVNRWQHLPEVHQLFVLWHADVYHVDWTDFAGLWGPHAHVIQEFLPLLWETIEGVVAGETADRATWAMQTIETFSSLWDDEGLMVVRAGHTAALQIVQQQALPTILDRFILRGLLERHGLVTITEEFGSLSKFTWTPLGETIIAAENKEFEAVVVDDLSRLSRSNHQMLTMVLKFNYLQVKIVSVSSLSPLIGKSKESPR